MTDAELQEFRDCTQKAPPAPWTVDGFTIRHGDNFPLCRAVEHSQWDGNASVAALRFIAAAREGVLRLFSEIDRLSAEVQRLKWRLNHQTEDDAEACQHGKHEDCGADSSGGAPE